MISSCGRTGHFSKSTLPSSYSTPLLIPASSRQVKTVFKSHTSLYSHKTLTRSGSGGTQLLRYDLANLLKTGFAEARGCVLPSNSIDMYGCSLIAVASLTPFECNDWIRLLVPLRLGKPSPELIEVVRDNRFEVDVDSDDSLLKRRNSKGDESPPSSEA